MLRKIFVFTLNLVIISSVYASENSAKICSATSKEGLKWSSDPVVVVDKASNSCAAVKDGKIYLYFVDANHEMLHRETVECAVSQDGVNFTKQHMIIAGIPTFSASDPSVVIDEKGNFRLYYITRDPIRELKKKEIHVAESSDGIFFEEIGVCFAAENVSKPEVFIFNQKWYMYLKNEEKNNVQILISEDGYKFKDLDEISFTATSQPISLPDGKLRFYTFIPGPGCHIVRSFISKDALTWNLEAENRLAVKDEELWDISVTKWQGNYKMFFTVKEK